MKTKQIKLNRNERARAVEKAIKLAWGSLKTHLPFCHKKSPEGKCFNKACVQEYAKTIYLLSKLY